MTEQKPATGRWYMTGYGFAWIVLTDANYGNPFWLRPDHVTGITIVSEQTYREGVIPDGVERRTVVYSLGGNQLAVRESPERVAQLIGEALGANDNRGGHD